MMKRISLVFGLIAVIACFELQAQESLEITFTHEGHTVNGTLTKPLDVASRMPAIIIGPGSGPNDRDGTFPVVGGNAPCLFPDLLGDTLRSYKQLAETLSRAGYAVLRYDKLEYTYTFNELAPISFEKLWLPVNSAVDYLKTRSDIDTNKIVLVGHSEGSYMIPYIAQNRNDIKALISLAGPKNTFDSLLAYQFFYLANECGGDTTDARNQGAQILTYYNLIRDKAWNGSTPSLFGVEPPVWYDYTVVTDSVVQRYDAAGLPTLFVGLGEDYNVPTETELAGFERDITTAADFYNLPGLIHQMTPTDNPNISSTLTDTLLYWLRDKGVVGIKDPLSNITAFTIFPNPASKHLQLSFSVQEGGVFELSMFNILGVEVASKPIAALTSGEQELSFTLPQGISSGIYFCTLKNENGASSVTRRVLVQK